ncbi:MAG: hypothetical protein AB1640_18405 [bacterium]
MSLLSRVYYLMKPVLPRRLQILLRRKWVARVRRLHQDTWPVDRAAGDPPRGWRGWPQGKRFALVLTHDVETAAGHRRCAELAALEEKLGLRSAFNFVPERYTVSAGLRDELARGGFEIGVHGLLHDGRLYESRAEFDLRAKKINAYLRQWRAVGFRSPSMQHNLDWIRDLEIEYDASTFDTDPFEPQPDGARTIFPFFVEPRGDRGGYVELPYTLPQDFTLFVLLREPGIAVWKEKLAWIAEKGGMALLIAHPDYMRFQAGSFRPGEYPVRLYLEFLSHVRQRYENLFWNALPREVARFWRGRCAAPAGAHPGAWSALRVEGR